MNLPDDLSIGRASRSEIDTMAEWAAAEGWNPGLRDAEYFYAADPEGFWVARADGAPVACISLVNYGGAFAFLGFYIARPDMRGRGIGYALWNEAMAACPAATIGLDGVVDQQDNHRKSGFVLAHRNRRYGGMPKNLGSDRQGLIPLTPDLMDNLRIYDRHCFPAPRDAFLEKWLTCEGQMALAAQENGTITGYGAIRPCRSGHKIGPLFADSPEIAARIFDSLVTQAPNGPVFVDPPEPNEAAVSLARARGLEPVFETARMYRGPAPAQPLDRIFGITAFELG